MTTKTLTTEYGKREIETTLYIDPEKRVDAKSTIITDTYTQAGVKLVFDRFVSWRGYVKWYGVIIELNTLSGEYIFSSHARNLNEANMIAAEIFTRYQEGTLDEIRL